MIGRIVKSWKIVSAVEDGGTIPLYRGEHIHFSSPVRIRAITLPPSRREEMQARLFRRIEVLRRLDHPHIGGIIDLFEEDGTLFLVMEDVAGERLDEMIVRQGRLTPDAALRIARGIVKGLHYAHGHNVVHGRLEPSHIIVSATGLPKIVGFEIAWIEGGKERPENPYLPPEKRHAPSCDRQDDLYAAGAILYEMLTGILLTSAKRVNRMIGAYQPIRSDTLHEGIPGVPKWLSEVVEKALADDPRLRHPDTESFLEALATDRNPCPGRSAKRRGERKSDIFTLPLSPPNVGKILAAGGRAMARAFSDRFREREGIAPHDLPDVKTLPPLMMLPGYFLLFLAFATRTFSKELIHIASLFSISIYRDSLFLWQCVLIFATYAYWMVFVYRTHKILEDVTGRTYVISPEKAMILHFIPIYNIYWQLKWTSEFNLFFDDHTELNNKSGNIEGIILFFTSLPGIFFIKPEISLLASLFVSNMINRKLRIVLYGRSRSVVIGWIVRILALGIDPIRSVISWSVRELKRAIPWISRSDRDRKMAKVYKIALSIAILGSIAAGAPFAFQRLRGLQGDENPDVKEDARNSAPMKTGRVRIPPGCFAMGSYRGEGDEQPVEQVCLKAFYIDKTEVTVAQYQRCVEAGGCSSALLDQSDWGSDEACNWGKPGRENHPINCVGWSQAKEYCRWAGGRLPTEREWEYAARGERGWEYPWGDTEADCDHAVMHDGEDGCGAYSTMPVGSKPAGASPFGLLDMAGNVREWIYDWYAPLYHYRRGFDGCGCMYGTCDLGPYEGTHRVNRGGGWMDGSAELRAPYRNANLPANRGSDLGFRCVYPRKRK
ncbi:MAG: hypothetical protein D6812_13930 [Deltaproteobacteria bacterium]|nr:MAG: hypothetical protein D6812_13930 [Deltaproteobacteria bacterium]